MNTQSATLTSKAGTYLCAIEFSCGVDSTTIPGSICQIGTELETRSGLKVVKEVRNAAYEDNEFSTVGVFQRESIHSHPLVCEISPLIFFGYILQHDNSSHCDGKFMGYVCGHNTPAVIILGSVLIYLSQTHDNTTHRLTKRFIIQLSGAHRR